MAMAKEAIDAGPTYIPKGSMCGSCERRGPKFMDFCGALPFNTYPIHKKHNKFTVQVICKEYRKKDEPH